MQNVAWWYLTYILVFLAHFAKVVGMVATFLHHFCILFVFLYCWTCFHPDYVSNICHLMLSNQSTSCDLIKDTVWCVPTVEHLMVFIFHIWFFSPWLIDVLLSYCPCICCHSFFYSIFFSVEENLFRFCIVFYYPYCH